MIAEKQTKSNIGVGVGFLLALGGRLLAATGGSSQSQGLVGLGIALSFVGSAIFIWGCVNYAQGKGYSPWLGALGLLSCIGLIILVLLPDKMKGGGFGGPGTGGLGIGGPGTGGYVPPQPGVWPPPPSGTAPPPASGPPPGAFGNEPPPPARKSLGGDDL